MLRVGEDAAVGERRHRFALVTGSSTGIGRASALALADAGFSVFAGVRKQADADSLRAERSEGVEPVTLDVTDAQAIKAAAAHIDEAAGGRLDGLVNNAGVAVPGPLEYVDIDGLRAQLEVNLVGQLALTQ